VLGKLRPEPSVHRCDEADVGCVEPDLVPGGHIRVGNPDAGRCGLKVAKTRHILLVKPCRIRKIAALELLRLLRKVPANELYLIAGAGIFGHDTLYAAGYRHFKDVNGLGNIEGHYGVRFVMHVRLPGLRKPGAAQE